MKIGKPKSKRTPVRLRHKIEKASAAKKRKDKKLAKKDPTWRSRLKKDPGIPNLFPYKDRILAEIEEGKQQKLQETERRREEARALKRERQAMARGEGAEMMDEDGETDDEEDEDEDGMDEDGEGDSSNPMAALLASARARAADYEKAGPQEGDSEDDDDDEEEDEHTTHNKSRLDTSVRAYGHLFKEVLSSADIILYVLDARDPQSTRSIPTEREVAAFEGGRKRLVLILNKIDLVPAQVLARWLTYLRRFHLTLPIRASSPAPNAKIYEHKGLTTKSTAETLLRALKTYAAKQELGRALSVGVIGYPNVGKSSVINALVAQLGRKKAPAPTGAEAGVTKALRSVKLDSKLTLIDSPGVPFAPEKETGVGAGGSKGGDKKGGKEDAHARRVLLNAVPPKEIEDPMPAVQLLLRRVAALPEGLASLEKYYGIPPLVTVEGDMVTDFLVQVARKRGRLGRGGVPNLSAAGMSVLGDWRDGRIGAWVEPPRIEVLGVGGKDNDVGMEEGDDKDDNNVHDIDRKEIVTEWAKEFELDGLWGGSGSGGSGAGE